MIPKNQISFTARSIQLVGYLTVLYLALIFLLPVNAVMVHYNHWSPLEYRFLTTLTALPTIIVWFFAFWGYAKLHDYSRSISKSKEGPHFKQLRIGITWLAWSLPIVTLANYTLSHAFTRWPSFHNSSIILSNYVSLVFPLIAFVIISIAASGLIGSSRPSLNLLSARLTMLVFLIVGVIFCFLVFRTLDSTNLTSANNPFHLPAWLIITTIIIPFLYSWFVGLLAAYEISLFSYKVDGLIYRKPLQLLAGGLTIIIISAVCLQYFSSVIPRSDSIILNTRLVLLITFRITSAIGFIMLAVGANRLKKIEEV